jgi:hypothetical protein
MSQRILPLILALGAVASGMAPAFAAQLVSTPRATALPITATNRPFLGAATTQQATDLKAQGYVEQEYLVEGVAAVYDWAPAGARERVQARDAKQPYVTRMLVRRPVDARRSSGRVVVELLSAAGGYDTSPLWGMSSTHFLHGGDIWVGLTVKPSAAETLRRFDAQRYARLNFAVAQPTGCKVEPANTDTGLAWDIIAQVGALLRSSSKENPVVDVDVRRIVVAGYAQAGGYVAGYVNVAHDPLRLGNGEAIYDAYVDAAGAIGAAPINACAAPLGDADPRRQVLPREVPVITVMSQTDAARTQWMRRTDGDAENDVYRLYEIAGMAHAAPWPAGLPSVVDAKIAGLDPAVTVSCADPVTAFPSGLAMNAIWQQLDDLLVQKTPLAKLARIEVGADGVVRGDSLGNALGGWRLPQLDVPLAVYRGSSRARADAPGTQGLCALTGSMQKLDAARLKALYGNRAAYLKRFNAAVDTAAAERRLTLPDAAAVKAQATKAVPQF